MADWQNIMVDLEQMEPGKFYYVYTNSDNSTLIIDKAQQDATNTQVEKNKNEIQAIVDYNLIQDNKIQALENKDNNVDSKILDNTQRINNLEDRTLDKELMYALDLASIKIPIMNQRRIEIEHNRKEIHLIKVMMFEYENFSTKREKNITAGTTIFEEETKDQQGTIISKKIILDFGDNPINGYTLII